MPGSLDSRRTARDIKEEKMRWIVRSLEDTEEAKKTEKIGWDYLREDIERVLMAGPLTKLISLSP